MQFYIVHPDPATNAKLLPDYALKQVNIKEGFQIISDICHRFGITFEGQNKPYNTVHPLTRSFSNNEKFLYLCKHYTHCCKEYVQRYKKTRKEIKIWETTEINFFKIEAVLPEDEHGETLYYLANEKQNKLLEGDDKKLAKIFELRSI